MPLILYTGTALKQELKAIAILFIGDLETKPKISLRTLAKVKLINPPTIKIGTALIATHQSMQFWF
jgi:hypothetical protein